MGTDSVPTSILWTKLVSNETNTYGHLIPCCYATLYGSARRTVHLWTDGGRGIPRSHDAAGARCSITNGWWRHIRLHLSRECRRQAPMSEWILRYRRRRACNGGLPLASGLVSVYQTLLYIDAWLEQPIVKGNAKYLGFYQAYTSLFLLVWLFVAYSKLFLLWNGVQVTFSVIWLCL
jgi:hypothetical protein